MKGWKFFQSIQWKLVVIYLLLILISMQIIGIYFIRSLESYYLDNFNETFATQGNLLAVNLERYLTEDGKTEAEKRADIDYLVDNLFALNGVDVSIIDSNGVILSSTEKVSPSIIGQKIYQTEVNRALLGTRDEAIRIDAKTGHRTKYLALPIKQGNNVLGAVFMKASIEGVYDTIYRISNILMTATLIALLFTAWLGFILSRTITKPIKDITTQAVSLTKGDFNQRVKIYGDDEIGRLADTFNKMAIRLKEAIDQNEEEKEKFASILSHMSDGVIATNAHGRIIVVNQRALEIIGFSESEVIEKQINQLFSLHSFPPAKEEESMIVDYEVENEHKALKMTFNKIHRINRGEIGMIIVLQDVTKEQKLEQIRKDFVANVSHELRTPLTTIKSYLEALEDGAVEDIELSHRFIKVASHETDRMIRLVSDLLHLSHLDDQQTKPNKTLVSVKEMIEDVIDRFSFQSKQRSIDLSSHLPEYLPTVELDRDHIDQVLDNLISNALKYTKEGGEIIVSARLKHHDLIIEVVDTGIGISKKHLSRLFERFYRVDKARSREMGGTGLGLAIAKEIVKAHDGDIMIESEVDKGTRVIVTIPVSK
ncbi:cell wall metabolism sensor histidine kinase WalK [Tepidibacillus sp. HK-1]|uniref:cell wall metabolism sensor histidine kinase WalK n=1 Tax=Tepidibacillus sp. HK-1 TaxID=1883407 RepID=UPI00085336E2|nr:cell wall metabolism sensor histidine kinase WalK [Tepidibacillus sp. HK-1]GBF11527.1 sensor histidine kinase YycG [Tepidibacillus sp. HK-1]